MAGGDLALTQRISSGAQSGVRPHAHGLHLVGVARGAGVGNQAESVGVPHGLGP
ncbi:hypothetical protein [Streptomyces aurantiogriseus]|uniref:hypothetical protein n=1 Tax=Streptomyces aurantiogriseus TaxID=66870 RepID=UPI001676F7B4|nr:hypothetical protein [Streptomyces aurantiogriseus]